MTNFNIHLQPEEHVRETFEAITHPRYDTNHRPYRLIATVSIALQALSILEVVSHRLVGPSVFKCK